MISKLGLVLCCIVRMWQKILCVRMGHANHPELPSDRLIEADFYLTFFFFVNADFYLLNNLILKLVIQKDMF